MTDREKLEELLSPVFCERCYTPYDDCCNSLEEAVDHLLGGGVEVREKGEWVETKNGFHCYRCKRKPGQHPTKRGVFLSDFCPNCGADMRKGENG